MRVDGERFVFGPADPEVTERALCATLPKHKRQWFFANTNERKDRDAAIAICCRCPVQRECLNEALRSGPVLHGIWGGTTKAQRMKMFGVRARFAEDKIDTH